MSNLFKYSLLSGTALFVFLNQSIAQNLSYKLIDLKNYISAAIAISIDTENNIFVLDSNNNKLIKLDDEGKFIKDIGSWGWGNFNFDKPISVDASDGLNVYVSDYYNHRIVRFNKQLEYISTLYKKGADNLHLMFGLPTAIAVDRFSNLFIYDNENKRILKFDKDGNIKNSFGGYESVTHPIKFEIDFENNLYVLEKNKMWIFDNWGTRIGIIKFDSSYTVTTFCLEGTNVYTIHSGKYFAEYDSFGRQLGQFDLTGYFTHSFEGDIVDVKLLGGKYYFLTHNAIIISAKIDINNLLK
jgi:hypothetical protein